MDLEPPPPDSIIFRPDDPNLLFTYREPKSGRFTTSTSAVQIPDAERNAVVITDLSIPPEARGSGRYVHVADLTRVEPNGSIRTAVASRYGFERGESDGESTSIDVDQRSAPVVVYSASWCGVCKKTKRLLTTWRVPFEEKDIEASRSAREELAMKSQTAGVRPGGVPVIDVNGQLMQGLDEPRLKIWLDEAGLIPR